jgi:hypothetical protein
MALHMLDLPVDILALILTPLLIQGHHPIPLCPCGALADGTKSDKNKADITANLVPILLIHPAIYAIAAPLFYQGGKFVLDLGLKHGLHVRRCLDDQAEEDAAEGRGKLTDTDDTLVIRRRKSLLLLPDALRRIRHLEIKLLKLRGWIDVRVVPLVRDMIVKGTLGTLVIKIYASSADGIGSSMFTRPPLAGLLSLLSDPYLQTARLWVSAAAAHGGAWKPFCLSTPDEHEDLVRIDWARILRQLDPEGREVAVLVA